MHALLFGLGLSVVIGIPIMLLVSAGAELKGRALQAGALTGAILGLINWPLLYMTLPTVGLNMDTFWKTFWIPFVEGILILAITSYAGDDDRNGFTFNFGTGAASMLLIIMFGLHVFSGVWNTERAHQLSGALTATMGDPGLSDINDPDPEQIPQMNEPMALNKARQAMNQLTNIQVGEFRGNASSVFEITGGTYQIIRGKTYWVFPPRPTGWRNSNKVNGIAPFYMRVSATDPNAEAEAITQTNDGKPIAITYSPGGYFSHDIFRHVWTAHPGKVLNDPTLEIDDNGVPWYTLTKEKLTLNSMPTVPNTLLLVNASSGEITEFPLDKVPAWVDRIFSEHTVKTWAGWWGRWAQAKWQFNEATANRYKVPDSEEPAIVYNKSGHASFRLILTSYSSDTAASYLVMVDARTGKATIYQIKNLTVASVAESAISKSPGTNVGNVKLRPTMLIPYKVYGQLAWVSPMEAEGDDHHLYRGTGIVSATDPNGSTVAVGVTKQQAFDKWRQVAFRGQGTDKGQSENSNVKTVSGTVAWVNNLVENGNSVIYFGLAEDPKHQFKASPGDDIPEIRTIHVGAKVTVSYVDVGDYRLDVNGYNDHTADSSTTTGIKPTA